MRPSPEKMASCRRHESSSPPWSSALRLLEAGCFAPVRGKQLLVITKMVIAREDELLCHGKDNTFYLLFAALASHHISSGINDLGRVSLPAVLRANQVLFKFLLKSLHVSPDSTLPVSQLQLLLVLRGLFTGIPMLAQHIVTSWTDKLKASSLPQEPSPTKAEEKAEEKSEVVPAGDLLEELTLSSLPPECQTEDSSMDQGEGEASGSAQRGNNLAKYWLAANMSNLSELGATSTLLQVCLTLPQLKRFMDHHSQLLAGHLQLLPTSLRDAVALRQNLKVLTDEIGIVWHLMSLPILEPLTSERVDSLTKISCACLHVGLAVTAAHTVTCSAASTPAKGSTSHHLEEDHLHYTASIVQMSLDVFDSLSALLQTSVRTNGMMVQNIRLLEAWCILGALHMVMGLSSAGQAEKTKDPVGTRRTDVTAKTKDATTTRPLSGKGYQIGMDGLIVALASHGLSQLKSLFDDFHLEYQSQMTSNQFSQYQKVDIHTRYTAWERIQLLTDHVPMVSLLFHIFTSAYKKACVLQRQRKGSLSSEPVGSSDSNTFYEDDFSSSEQSSEDEEDDDDSELILGHWFEETISPQQEDELVQDTTVPSSVPDGTPQRQEFKGVASLDAVKLATDRSDPETLLSLATEVLTFITTYLVNSTCLPAKQYFSASLSDQQMAAVAIVIKDLDREYTDTEAWWLQGLSSTLLWFLHQLLVTDVLPAPIQVNLLSHLGVSPRETGPWPLHLKPHCLAVLTRYLLLQQRKLSPTADNTDILNIWERFLDTLKNKSINQDTSADTDDLNVEHLQLLLMLFHNLSCNNRRKVLLHIATGLISIANARNLQTSMPLALSRLVLVFNYFIHNFSAIPGYLVEQVRRNLFSGQFGGVIQTTQLDDESKAKMWFTFPDCETNYRKNVHMVESNLGSSLNPKFYDCLPADMWTNRDIPSIDEMAVRSLLSELPSVELNYHQLYMACVLLLSAGSKCLIQQEGNNKTLPYLVVCCVQYNWQLVWRVLGSLPPSVSFLKQLQEDEDVDDFSTLHALRWLARLPSSIYTGWVMDWLCWQDLPSSEAESLLTTCSRHSQAVKTAIKLAEECMARQISELSVVPGEDLVCRQHLSTFRAAYVLDSVIGSLQVALDQCFFQSMVDTDPHKAMDIARNLLPATFQLVEIYAGLAKYCILYEETTGADAKDIRTPDAFVAYQAILGVGCTRLSKVSSLGLALMASLPPGIRKAVDNWNNTSGNDYPSTGAWRNTFANDPIPCESYTELVVKAHVTGLSSQVTFSLKSSVKHVLMSLVHFCGDLIVWCPDALNSQHLIQVLQPLLLDGTSENLTDFLIMTLERVLGPLDGEDFASRLHYQLVATAYKITVMLMTSQSGLDETILHDCIKFMDVQLEKSPGCLAMKKFFCDDQGGQLASLLLSARHKLSAAFTNKVLKFFNKLFILAEKNPDDKNLHSLCHSFSSIKDVNSAELQDWLTCMITGSKSESDDKDSYLSENRFLLQTLTSHLVKDTFNLGEDVGQTLLLALLPMGTQMLQDGGTGFTDLLIVMATLAGAGSGTGHIKLFQAAIDWICTFQQAVAVEDVGMTVETGRQNPAGESLCYLLMYVADVLIALKQATGGGRSTSPLCEREGSVLEETDWADDLVQEEEDEDAEDSDEDSLCNKLCTFTVTQKEFMNQHWYHCHTCKMNDGVGVCSICAKVCHRDHDVTYAKYGSFFCDCGAKEDGSCQALVKRMAVSSTSPNGNVISCKDKPGDLIYDSHFPSPPAPEDKVCTDGPERSKEVTTTRKIQFCRHLECFTPALLKEMESLGTADTVLQLLTSLLTPATKPSQESLSMGNSKRVEHALNQLHTQAKVVETTDQLMVPTLGSQEGAFENVRMNYNGDQGQTIRQLISAQMLRRVAMCCLTSSQGRRQHLAVSHEKGKITLLQLSALLKQADSSKRKLTLTRLSSAPMPFTVISITGNQCNEDFLAVCGLKDCHVLTFSSSGAMSDHLVLHPQLETGNFIIKAIWLPGSQTEIAVITADFVKIYNLAVDVLSPGYYFLLPSGKIRDVTFIFVEDMYYIVLMSSAGYMYIQAMERASSAIHGPFYITTLLEPKHPDIKESNGQICGGGVSLYYSHALQLLFFSYTQGKNFISPLKKIVTELSPVFPVTLRSSNGAGKGTSPSLCQWSEVLNHPGLICCLTQTAGTPVVIMVKPDSILIQEIKTVPAKSKIQDMVAIRHTSASSDNQRTTLILLCEDGSLKIYMANVDSTSYWMQSAFQSVSVCGGVRPVSQRKPPKTGRPSSQVTFPVDFFEHQQSMTDVEFGGNDLLQVYNLQQLKHRLNTTGMFVASTKPSGFSIEIFNSNPTMVMTGLRVHVGSQSVERAPSFLEIFGRPTQCTLTRNRWFDLPFTREESLLADRSCTLFVGASLDPSGATMVDSIKVYGKIKEVFGWPDELEEFPSSSTGHYLTATSAPNPQTTVQPEETLSTTDRLITSALEVLEGCFAIFPDSTDSQREGCLKMTMELLNPALPLSVQQHAKALLSSLHTNKVDYYEHKDQAQLLHVVGGLATHYRRNVDMDVEIFQRIVMTAHSVAMARPHNLCRYAILPNTQQLEGFSPSETKMSHPFLETLQGVFWHLHSIKPANPALAPLGLPGLTPVDVIVAALVDIIHAFTLCNLDLVPLACQLYVQMLLAQDLMVSFSCKQALIHVLRPRLRGPSMAAAPGGDQEEDKQPQDQPGPGQHLDTEARSTPGAEPQDEAEGLSLEGRELMGDSSSSGDPHLEALLADGAEFPAMLDIPPDADDETMVELAIALSLQDQRGHSSGLGLQGLTLDTSHGQSHSSLEAGTLSDTTASAAASDDEGSTAATDGSTLRTSPAEHAGSGESESSGSAADSITGEQNVSGRSSTFGDSIQDGSALEASSAATSSNLGGTSLQQEGEESEGEADVDRYRMQSLRRALLEMLMKDIPRLRDVGGTRAIPFLQVVLMLSSDLDCSDTRDCATLNSLLSCLLQQLDISTQDVTRMAERSKEHEVQLVIMRLLSVFMSRTKILSKTRTESSSELSQHTSGVVLSAGLLDYCLLCLKELHKYWTDGLREQESQATVVSNLLKPHQSMSPPDMSPFFLRQYVKGHAQDVFEAYPQLLTEMVLRLPCQIKKVADLCPSVTSPVFQQDWFHVLSEYMLTQHTTFIRRQVRKLMLYLCGSKEKYRQLRDLHALQSHMGQVKELCEEGGFKKDGLQTAVISLPYDKLIIMMDHLKACTEVAATRTSNWQTFCHQDKTVVWFLLQVSFLLDEGVAPVLLQLLSAALCCTPPVKPTSTGSAKHRKDKELQGTDDSVNEGQQMCQSIVQQLLAMADSSLWERFIHCFLLHSNSSAVRWQAHLLLLSIFSYGSAEGQNLLLDLMWGVWPHLPSYGRKAAQFVDLLGYFSLKCTAFKEKASSYLTRAFTLLKQQNRVLTDHCNANIYNLLSGLVEFDGFYLETDPCAVCNNPEMPFVSVKLSAVKVDSRFTTTTQIIKLLSPHIISKIAVRLTDLKRTKMVRTVHIYYNNRTVPSIVELKNRQYMWHRAKKVVLSPGQAEVKVDFLLPITASNLMIEYADFYDNLQASAETLQCPRCSASVPANPGVCSNCGENVFQCHKCRSINYDEKDPFLCNNCGFCKYAKFDFTLTAKTCTSVDSVDNEEDRKKAISTINSLLDKADRIYHQLKAHRLAIEGLLAKTYGHPGDTVMEEPSPGGSTSSSVSKIIQQLAHRYCTDCKTAFDELSKIIQKVMALREKLLGYDEFQSEGSHLSQMTSCFPSRPISPHPWTREIQKSRCYGCSSAAVQLCVTLLRALATETSNSGVLVSQGLVQEVMSFNLKRGTPAIRKEVRHLLCLLTRDNTVATQELNHILQKRIGSALKAHRTKTELGSAVCHELLLLADAVELEGDCWEEHLRCTVQLLMLAMQSSNPTVVGSITLPCLQILQCLSKPPQPTSNKNKDKSVSELGSRLSQGAQVYVHAKSWLEGEQSAGYKSWKERVPQKGKAEVDAHTKYLMEKYGWRWHEKVFGPPIKLTLGTNAWIYRIVFNPASQQARQAACDIIYTFAQQQEERYQQVLDLLTRFLCELGAMGENGSEFMALYKKLSAPKEWKKYLAIKGLLPHLGHLITKEVEELTLHEEKQKGSDLTKGCALKMLTELLASLVDVEVIKQQYKKRLVGVLLHGYLCLRRLLVQRTKFIDETQEMLLELLEDISTGNEVETRSFMAVCVETLQKYPLSDLVTPVFIFERLCNIIFPEEQEATEFFITLDKDPQQEDFLQGRMQGNPYSSNEPGLGPLMRDVKNKICQDCELVALLEDDSGMELLVNNKIVSLDLLVQDVYRKIWCAEHEGEAMRVVYRMRGLLGDATEEFVETLENTADTEVDTEETYKLASVLSECGGLQAMLRRFSSITDLVRGGDLLQVLLKLFSYCVKLKVNRQALIQPSLNTLPIMLGTLNLVLQGEPDGGVGGAGSLAQQLLSIMEMVLQEANLAADSTGNKTNVLASVERSQLILLLESINRPFVRAQANVLQALMRLVPFVAFGAEEKMTALMDHFKPYLAFERFDQDHTADDETHLDCFCQIMNAIEKSPNGERLKDLMIKHGVVKLAIDYITCHAPSSANLDSESWKEFIARPALPFILRMLTGQSQGHPQTQLLVGDACILVFHCLEQVSSKERVGSLAENLMEALRENDQVASQIEDARRQTRAEKKKMAMAMRQKQLGVLGMTTNEQGKIVAKSGVLKQMEELIDEAGLICCICREGYKFQPNKVLGIYTFTKRATLEEFENKPRKMQGYSTVTHFNIVHYDCHMAAVRHARGREEWESAALQNANTKCNGLLPAWGLQVPESAFASCLARHNTYLQECTGIREPTYQLNIHDLKLLLLRFAQEMSFSDESGGGGRESNMRVVPYMIHNCLYVINTTRAVPREEKTINTFLQATPDKWVALSYEVDGPLYLTLLALLVLSPERWKDVRLQFLSRLIVLAQARHLTPGGTSRLSSVEVQSFAVYKPVLIYFGLIDCLYNMLQKVDVSQPGDWSKALAAYVRSNDQHVLETADKLLERYQEQMLPVESIAEYLDVVGLLGEIQNTDTFVSSILASVNQ
ncbi:E3 ubiquitin-protein ligase UBR4-like isoform X2 [Branchiostoma floridae x Branchiostoma japonicum]